MYCGAKNEDGTDCHRKIGKPRNGPIESSEMKIISHQKLNHKNYNCDAKINLKS